MRKSIKWFERGIFSKKELKNKLLSCAHEIMKAMGHFSDWEQWDRWSPATEIDRILSLLLDGGDYDCEYWDDRQETDSHLPLDYVIQRCRCTVNLLEMLVSRNEKEDMSQQRAKLAALLAVSTTCDGLLVTDHSHGELHSTEIEAIVRQGGTVRFSALSSADARLLAKVRDLIDDWYAGRLCNRTLCRRLKSCLNKVNIVHADWWDLFYIRLKDLWIVSFGKCSKKARALLTGKATREEIYSLLDGIEQLVHAPLSRLTR